MFNEYLKCARHYDKYVTCTILSNFHNNTLNTFKTNVLSFSQVTGDQTKAWIG